MLRTTKVFSSFVRLLCFHSGQRITFPPLPSKTNKQTKEQSYCLKVSKPFRCFAVETGQESVPRSILGKEPVRTLPVGSPPAHSVDPPGRGHAGPDPRHATQAARSTQHHAYLLTCAGRRRGNQTPSDTQRQMLTGSMCF